MVYRKQIPIVSLNKKSFQVQSAKSNEEIQSILGRDEFNFRFHCGYSKPTSSVSMTRMI